MFAVAVIQVLSQGVVLILVASGTSQTEGEGQTQTTLHPGLALARKGASMHLHDRRAVRASPGPGPEIS
jgi:hypothetical protein